MPSHAESLPLTDPDTPVHFISLAAAKELSTRHTDALYDQLSPLDAVEFAEWQKDDADSRFLEMDDGAGWPP